MRVFAAAAAGLILAACGGGGSSPSGPNPGALTITITRQNGSQSFSPNPASAGGQTVEQFGQFIGVLDVQARLSDPGDDGRPAGEAVIDRPAVPILAQVKSAWHP